MNEITKNNEKYMTVKELSGVLNLNVRTIQLKTKELFPRLIKERETTYLNEYQVTAIKLACEKKFAASTDLEMLLLSQKVDKWKDDKIKSLQAENEIMLPKAESFDTFINSDGLHSIKEVAKMLGTGQNRLFKTLRENKYFFYSNGSNMPYQQYIDNGYFEVKQKVINNNKSIPIIKATAKGVVMIEKLLLKLNGN